MPEWFVVGEDEVGRAVAVDVAIQPPSERSCRDEMLLPFGAIGAGFSHQKMPLVIQPAVTNVRIFHRG